VQLQLHQNKSGGMILNNTALIDEILHKVKIIAVVGMSNNPARDSHHVGMYLAGNGYRVLPVNPALKEIAGLTRYPTLDAAQDAMRQQAETGIDLVDVFRAPEFVDAIVDDVIRLGVPYLWLQDGVINPEAVKRAQAAGVGCVMDDCILRQHSSRRSLP
jgi:uncharacterized protein